VLAKKIISGVFLTLVLVFVSCFESESPSNPPVTSTTKSYGTFVVKLSPYDSATDNPAYTILEGAMCDGPTPPIFVFKEAMSSGPCKLFKVDAPFCKDPCGSGFCVAEDSCMPQPHSISVGKLTVTGMKFNGEKKTYTINPDDFLNYGIVGSYPDYPPTPEGDTITVSASGNGSVPPFTVKVRDIAPLVVSPDELVLENGKPITVKWTPPTVQGVSTISILIDISYHGGTKGKIEFECDDNGSVTIPGEMLDKLKSYGMAGWPKIEITRQSVAFDEKTKAKVVVQCTITKLLTIPGLISCSNGIGCPDGQSCVDQRCQ
jgi:hypothetical protein